jgi:hypothetical protein
MVDEEELADFATDLMIIVAQHVETKCAHCNQLFSEAQKRAASRKGRSLKKDHDNTTDGEDSS